VLIALILWLFSMLLPGNSSARKHNNL
jgi:hypothetical protein